MENKYIVFNSRTELLRFDVGKVVYIEGDGNYTHIVTVNKLKGTVCVNLSQIEKIIAEQLGPDNHVFMRIGKRFIINTVFVYQISVQNHQLVLSDCTNFAFRIGVSKDALKRMKELMLVE